GGAGTAGVGAANTTLVHGATTKAWIGAGAQITAGGTGVSLTANASEDIISIAAGIAVGGTAGVAGSAAVNVLNETTYAYVGDGANVHTTAGDLSISSMDYTGPQADGSDGGGVISVAGSLAGGGTVGAGVGADVGVYNKDTRAFIGKGVTTDI